MLHCCRYVNPHHHIPDITIPSPSSSLHSPSFSHLSHLSPIWPIPSSSSSRPQPSPPPARLRALRRWLICCRAPVSGCRVFSPAFCVFALATGDGWLHVLPSVALEYKMARPRLYGAYLFLARRCQRAGRTRPHILLPFPCTGEGRFIASRERPAGPISSGGQTTML